MKRVKKIAALLLAALLLCSLSLTAFADDETGSKSDDSATTTTTSGTNDNTGTITIDNAVVDKTYTIYQILSLESYSTTKGAYSYKATTDWDSLVTGTDIKDKFFSVDSQGYVTWVKDADVATFATLAKAYAEELSGNQGSKKAESSTVTFSGLNLGYYLVVSDLGAICSLDTTNPSVTIKEKNGAPTVEKKVEEDSKAGTKDVDPWGSTNDDDIGQTVNFKTTINVVDGQPKSYVLHDQMSKGLTFDKTSVKVTRNGQELTSGTDYTLVTEDLNDDCTFEIRFTDKTENNVTSSILKPNDVVVVTYSATLNESAVVGLEGNTNTTKLKYKDTTDTEQETAESQTKTYTWDVDVLKYANGNESTVLKGAQFVLLKKVDNTEYFAVVADGKITGWTTEGVAPETGADEKKTYATILTTDENGKIEIDGLDADTYYLREIKAPDGYNKLANDVEVVITGATENKTESEDETETEGEDGTKTLTYTTVVAKVNNQSGTELPSTGGVGTTLFYVIGSVLVLGAVVILITRKRMKA